MKEKSKEEEEHWKKMRTIFSGQKQHAWDYKDNPQESGIYRVELIHNGAMHNDGFKEIWRHSSVDYYMLSRMVDKCEIKSFKISLDSD